MRRFIALALVLTCVPAFLGFDDPPAPPPADSLMISDLHIVGNNLVPVITIVDAFGMKPGDPFKSGDVEAGLRRVNNLGYFYEDRTSYDTGVTPGGVFISLHVSELPALKIVEVRDAHVLTDADIIKALDLPVGEILNWNTINKGIDAVNAEFNRRGYPTDYFLVTVDIDDAQGAVIITVHESKVEGIEIEGNRKTRSWVLLRQIRTRPGDYLNRDDVEKDAYRLGNLGILEDLPEIGVRPGSQPGSIILIFKVKEAKTGRLTFGAGYGQNSGFAVNASVSEENWRGLAQSISLSASIGAKVDQFQFSFRNPLFRRTDDSFELALFRTQNILDFRNTQAQGTPIARYTTTQTGGSVVIDHPFNRVFVFSYGIDGREQHLKLESGTEISDLQKQKEGLTEGRIDSFSLGIARDTRLNKFDPFQGSRAGLNYSQGFSFLGADFSFSRYVLDLRKYIPLTSSNKWVLASRLKLGTANGTVPATDQFYIGGTETVRGYEFGRLRGFKMGLFNLEFRYRAKPVGGALFFDAGDAGPNFASDKDGNLVTEKFGLNNTVFSVGAGIRFQIRELSSLPIRLDFGYNLERGGVRFHFGFGQLF